MITLYNLDTEKQNPATISIDTCDTLQILSLINTEDKKVAFAVEKVLPDIAKAVDIVTNALQNDGRLIYIGSGTSGRIGIIDAVECPPTYGTDPDLVKGLIAGGSQAIFRAKEGAEDSAEYGITDLKSISLTDKDVVVGLSASGRTPYVFGALTYAKSLKARTVSISCSSQSKISSIADIPIEIICGPEVITGSTRMKAGTAQKMVLNMISTATMIRLGKVYKNLMIDVKATNQKLQARALSIVKQATDADDETCQNALSVANGQARTAIFMILTKLSHDDALNILNKHKGHISEAIEAWKRGSVND